MNFAKMILGTIDVSQEVIAVQTDEEFVKEFEGAISGIMAYIKNNKSLRMSKVRKDKECDALYNDLENVILKRFGIPYRILSDDGYEFTIAMTSTIDNIVNINAGDTKKYLEEVMRDMCVEYGKEPDCKFTSLKLSEIKNMNEAYKKPGKFLSSILEASNMIDRLFADGKLYADFKQAKIFGLEKKARELNLVTILNINFKYYINMNLSIREIAAIILHEIGHQFLDIAYGTMHAKDSISVIQSLSNDKLSNREKQRLVFKEITGKELKTDEDLRKLSELLFEKSIVIAKNSTPVLNSEVTADQFAARFGYGKELIEGLNKEFIIHERDENVGFRLILGFTLLVLTLVTITMTPFLFIIGIINFITALSLLTIGKFMDLDNVHEFSYARTRRMRLELIRQLRTCKHCNFEMKLLEDIEVLDDWLIQLGVDKNIFQLVYTIITGNKKEVGYRELYQRLEQVQENDLHIASAKIKGLRSLKANKK